MYEDLPMIERIGRALHDRLDEIVHQPLPEQWIDLINRMNFEEKVRAESGERSGEPRSDGRTVRRQAPKAAATKIGDVRRAARASLLPSKQPFHHRH